MPGITTHSNLLDAATMAAIERARERHAQYDMADPGHANFCQKEPCKTAALIGAIDTLQHRLRLNDTLMSEASVKLDEKNAQIASLTATNKEIMESVITEPAIERYARKAASDLDATIAAEGRVTFEELQRRFTEAARFGRGDFEDEQ